MTHRHIRLAVPMAFLKVATLSSLLFGCSSGLVVGEEAEEQAEPTGTGSTEPEQPAGMGATAGIPMQFEDPGYPWGCGEAEGRGESYSWGSNDNDFEGLPPSQWSGHLAHGHSMHLTVTDNLHAYVVFGEAPLHSPPRDADLGWACDASFPDGVGCTKGPHTGLKYKVGMADLEGTRLRFSLMSTEPWEEWCGMQERLWIPGTECEFSAIDYSRGTESSDLGCGYRGPDVGDYEELDCAWLHLALEPTCTCNLEGCSANVGEEHEMPFDFTLSDDGLTMTGSYLEAETGQTTTVNLTLDQEL